MLRAVCTALETHLMYLDQGCVCVALGMYLKYLDHEERGERGGGGVPGSAASFVCSRTEYIPELS